jgi:hypothetical protein
MLRVLLTAVAEKISIQMQVPSAPDLVVVTMETTMPVVLGETSEIRVCFEGQAPMDLL